jgi:hypothetical protein
MLGVPFLIALMLGVWALPGLPATLLPSPLTLPLPIENVLPTPVSMRFESDVGDDSRSRLRDGEDRSASWAARWAFLSVRSISFRNKTESLE